jgi:uncharacterized membrane protein YgcG
MTAADAASAPKAKKWVPVKAPKCSSCDKSVYKVEELVADEKVFHKTCFKCEHCNTTLMLGNYASYMQKYYCKVRVASARASIARSAIHTERPTRSPDDSCGPCFASIDIFRAPEPKLKLKLAADDSPLVPAQPHFKQLFAEKGSYGESFGVVEPKKAWAATKATASPDGKSGGDGKAPSAGSVKALGAKFGGTAAASKCPVCAKTAYQMESTEVNGEKYHAGCFKCATCGVKLSLSTFVAAEGKLFCRRDVPKKECSVGMTTQIVAAMEAQRLVSDGKSSADPIARYASTPTRTTPTKPTPAESEAATPAESEAAAAKGSESPATVSEKPAADEPAAETPPTPAANASSTPDAPAPIAVKEEEVPSEAEKLEAELGEVMEQAAAVAGEIESIIDDAAGKASDAEKAEDGSPTADPGTPSSAASPKKGGGGKKRGKRGGKGKSKNGGGGGGGGGQ